MSLDKDRSALGAMQDSGNLLAATVEGLPECGQGPRGGGLHPASGGPAADRVRTPASPPPLGENRCPMLAWHPSAPLRQDESGPPSKILASGSAPALPARFPLDRS